MLRFLPVGLIIVFSSCSERTLNPDDVEYRRDENGSEILYQLGADEPYGSKRQAFVSDDHPNGKKHFKISFRDGRKDGSFIFWQNNGLKLLSGFFKEGKRDGLFTAYGRTGGRLRKELQGRRTRWKLLYYPASNSTSTAILKSSRKRAKHGELGGKNHLRMKVAFAGGNPSGPYKAYFHW